MKTVKFGIIGFGNIGKRHLQRIQENNNSICIAICDIKQKKLDEITDSSIKKFLNYKDLLKEKEIDVVTVATPNGLHSQMTIDALENNKDVVCEKPMALTTEAAKFMISYAQRHNRKLFIVKQNRFNPPVKKIRELINSGKLGRIYMVSVNCFWNRNDEYYKASDWKGTKYLDGGTLFTQFSHFIDIVYNLLGDFSSVYAKGKNYNHPEVQFEDTGVVLFELANGALGSLDYTTCSYNQNFEGSISIFGEKGTVKIGGQFLNTLEYYVVEGIEKIVIEKGNKPNDYGTYKGSMSNHDHVISNVVNTINGLDTVATSGHEGMKITQIIECMYESMKTGKEVKIHSS